MAAARPLSLRPKRLVVEVVEVLNVIQLARLVDVVEVAETWLQQ